MRIRPMTEEEAAVAGLLPKGIYPFEVAEAKEKTSKAGNDMIELRLSILAEDDSKHGVFDYLVESDGSAPKIRQFAVSVGMLPQYESGQFDAADMIGKTGVCKLYIKSDKTGAYPDKNAVGEYVKPTNGENAASTPKSKDIDDDIPF